MRKRIISENIYFVIDGIYEYLQYGQISLEFIPEIHKFHAFSIIVHSFIFLYQVFMSLKNGSFSMTVLSL